MKTEIWRTIAAGGTALSIPGLAGATTVITTVGATYTSSGFPGTLYGFAENADGTFTATGDSTGNFAVAPNAVGVVFTGIDTTVIADDAGGYPINFIPGDQVGPASPVSAWSSSGGWLMVEPKLGSGKTNFEQGSGWVGFAIPTGSGSDANYGAVLVTSLRAGSVTVNRILFETTANDPVLIATPEPSTFGLLALGAAGVLALRKRRKA